MSRKGNCWENAVAENFFKIIKSELIYQVPQKHFDLAKLEIFEFMKTGTTKKKDTHISIT
jgi:putative transposase